MLVKCLTSCSRLKFKRSQNGSQDQDHSLMEVKLKADVKVTIRYKLKSSLNFRLLARGMEHASRLKLGNLVQSINPIYEYVHGLSDL